MAKDSGKVNIHGKEYETVASRVQRFREKFPEMSLITEIVHRDDSEVVVKATISNVEGHVLATGHSEEKRAASQINRTSALENAETSAIGRALASFGFGGTEFASADEVANAIGQRNAAPAPKPAAKPAVGTAAPRSDSATPTQKARIKAFLTGLHVLPAEMAAFLESEFGIIPGTEMTGADAERIIKELEAMRRPEAGDAEAA